MTPLLIVVSCGLLLNVVVADDEKIKWQDLKTVTFYGGLMTKGRQPVPQISIGSDDKYTTRLAVDNVNITCRNIGPTIQSMGLFPPVNWNCSTDHFQSGETFKRVNILCECYNRCDDDYVAMGSCSVVYSSKKTNASIIIIAIMCSIIILACVFSTTRPRTPARVAATSNRFSGVSNFSL